MTITIITTKQGGEGYKMVGTDLGDGTVQVRDNNGATRVIPAAKWTEWVRHHKAAGAMVY